MTRVAFIFSVGGSECVTTLDVGLDGISEYTAGVVLTAFMNEMWVPFMATTATFVETRVGEIVQVAGNAGEGETHSLPANCALILQKNTGSSVRGRFFLPGLSEPDVDPGGRVGTELRNAVDDAAEAALATMIGAGVIPKVQSTVGAGSAVNITSLRTRPLIATLRNRIVTR